MVSFDLGSVCGESAGEFTVPGHFREPTLTSPSSGHPPLQARRKALTITEQGTSGLADGRPEFLSGKKFCVSFPNRWPALRIAAERKPSLWYQDEEAPSSIELRTKQKPFGWAWRWQFPFGRRFSASLPADFAAWQS